MDATLLSDLHLDRWSMKKIPEVKGLVLLAGDVSETTSESPVSWAKSNLAGATTVFVPGNHDFYDGMVGPLLKRWRAEAAGSNVHVLYNDTLDHEGFRILGTTLWSGLMLRGPTVAMHMAKGLHYCIPDFARILDNDGQRWRVDRMLDEHELALEFLRRELGRDRDVPKIVVTHWPPGRQSLATRFEADDLAPYFVNDYPDLVKSAALWLHGHTHDPCDYRIGRSPRRGRVICQPRGYPDEGRSQYGGRHISIEKDGRTQ